MDTFPYKPFIALLTSHHYSSNSSKLSLSKRIELTVLLEKALVNSDERQTRSCRAVVANNLAMEAHPGANEAHPGAKEAHPGAKEAHPGAMEAHPEAMEAHPGAK